MELPVIGHIPHAATCIPCDVKCSLTISGDDLKEDLRRLTDWYVDELFSWLGDRAVVCPVSRLVVDVERFEDDKDEVMAALGMGAVYTRTSDCKSLRRSLTDLERRDLIKRFYLPHHQRIEDKVRTCLDRCDRCLILDCHSFPSHPLVFELDQDLPRPDICIGTDPFHTPPALAGTVQTYFESSGLIVFQNKPYKGTYVPKVFLHIDARISSLMIEINRDLYMDEATGTKKESFESVKRSMAGLEEPLAKLLLPSTG